MTYYENLTNNPVVLVTKGEGKNETLRAKETRSVANVDPDHKQNQAFLSHEVIRKVEAAEGRRAAKAETA